MAGLLGRFWKVHPGHFWKAPKATRDLVVHNGGIVNELYLQKAGEKARGKRGDQLVVNKKYFYGALAKMKKVSGAIKRDVEKRYLKNKD